MASNVRNPTWRSDAKLREDMETYVSRGLRTFSYETFHSMRGVFALLIEDFESLTYTSLHENFGRGSKGSSQE